MMGSGSILNEGNMEEANKRLEGAIEDLRVKYEKINAEKAAAKAKKDEASAAKEAAEKAVEVQNDWTIGEDAELERLRQAS
jgi:hypothetical protein